MCVFSLCWIKMGFNGEIIIALLLVTGSEAFVISQAIIMKFFLLRKINDEIPLWQTDFAHIKHTSNTFQKILWISNKLLRYWSISLWAVLALFFSSYQPFSKRNVILSEKACCFLLENLIKHNTIQFQLFYWLLELTDPIAKHNIYYSKMCVERPRGC